MFIFRLLIYKKLATKCMGVGIKKKKICYTDHKYA